MPRPQRRQIKFDEQSANALLQEIYNDSHNIRAKIARLFTKWEQQIKENGEIAAVGETIAKLIVAEAKTVDQKLLLLRYLKEVIFAKANNSEDDEKGASVGLSKKERNQLIEEVTNNIHKDN